MIYFCPTPIGNLKDISLRTLEVLNSVDYILAEDTRVSSVLLNHYEIKKPLISFHKFNERQKLEKIISLVDEGNDLAVITDAGMPLISDPGYILVSELIIRGVEFTALPGANAALTALVLSGLSTEHFFFYGFLDAKKNKRLTQLKALSKIDSTLIFYESPHRIEDTLIDMLEVFGDRKVAIARELTKLHEEVIRTKLGSVELETITKKGEFVVVVDGYNDLEDAADIRELLLDKLKEGLSKSQAVKELAKETGLSKNDIYRESLDLDV